MNLQLLYQEDSTVLEFEAEVVDRIRTPNGQPGVVLDRTYFYPTGGGQEHDNGIIGMARVVDVYKDEANSRLVHILDGEVGSGPVRASIDRDRRLRHMQHHTAQHLLTQCILRETGDETVSANINGYTPSTLDILAPSITKPELDAAEQLTNQIIYEDRQVKTYFVSPDELRTIPLRRPPKVTENIRIVEIDGYDYSACGGTHVLHTGSIGLVKVLKAEKQNDKQRVYFVAGMQAMELYHQLYDSFTSLANQLSIAWQDLPDLVNKQAEQLASNQKELQALRQEAVKYEAASLVEAAEDHGSTRLVKAEFTQRPIGELRLLAEELRKLPGVVAYLGAFDGQKISLIVTCGEGVGKDARQLLTRQLAQINGRGGGDARMAQGGGAATSAQFATFLDHLSLDEG